MTNELSRRMDEHVLNAGNPDSFAGRYYCYHLVYYERFTYVQHAIDREKQIKKWSRKKKEELINTFNPDWDALNEEIKEMRD
ncbi:GIY-YIG nuclease family protein [Pontibacter virosus]|uniref:Putative endonuclease n=1 Tax=Pontibacter virosus TaxID=1765052 RepID=A0A2U1B379_9BACT|nr:GIY-YIG nuclease family protein [Pontibacter virosus]PVY43061.1 putative endonuclease [Pontibacter virosus]